MILGGIVMDKVYNEEQGMSDEMITELQQELQNFDFCLRFQKVVNMSEEERQALIDGGIIL